MSRSIERLDAVLKRVLGGASPLKRGLEEQELLASWPDVVGEKNAAHSRAIAVRDGVLWVQVESSVWAQELTLLKPQIQAALEKELGKGAIRDVRFHSGA